MYHGCVVKKIIEIASSLRSTCSVGRYVRDKRRTKHLFHKRFFSSARARVSIRQLTRRDRARGLLQSRIQFLYWLLFIGIVGYKRNSIYDLWGAKLRNKYKCKACGWSGVVNLWLVMLCTLLVPYGIGACMDCTIGQTTRRNKTLELNWKPRFGTVYES